MAARDAAILALLYGSGLRRAEAVGLDISDYDPEGGTLKVRGKGNKERLAHLGDASQAALDAWLFLRGTAPGALFVAIPGFASDGHRYVDEALSRGASAVTGCALIS